MKIALTSDTHYGFSPRANENIKIMLERLQSEGIDLIVHAGDWASHKSSHLISCVRTFRKYFPNTPIVGTLGNHDLAGESLNVLSNIQRLFLKHSILDYWTNGKIKVIAFQSWYNSSHPPSTDHYWMPKNITHQDMIVRSHQNFDNIIGELDVNTIVVSHFTPYNYRHGYNAMCGPMGMFDQITASAGFLCLGHSHLYMDEMIDGCRVMNCGSDYESPKYKIFEV
jgi:predicted phosphodiesterase